MEEKNKKIRDFSIFVIRATKVGTSMLIKFVVVTCLILYLDVRHWAKSMLRS